MAINIETGFISEADPEFEISRYDLYLFMAILIIVAISIVINNLISWKFKKDQKVYIAKMPKIID